MPTARWGFSTSVVDGKIYAIGGVGGSTKVEVYDPATDTWTQKADMQRGANLHGACVVDGKIYVIGGNPSTTGRSLATVHEYDPATDTWTAKADMPTPRDSLSTSVVDGKIYAIGGISYNPDYPVGEALTTVEEYDPATDTWTIRADMPGEKDSSATSVVDGKIYALGGWRNGPKASSAVVQYDPATDTWTPRAGMPASRGWAASAVVNGRIYVFGGGDDYDGAPLSTLFEYDPGTDTWTTRDDMPFERWVMSASVVDGRVYLIGGSASPWPLRPSLATVWEYDPESSE